MFYTTLHILFFNYFSPSPKIKNTTFFREYLAIFNKNKGRNHSFFFPFSSKVLENLNQLFTQLTTFFQLQQNV